MTTFATGVWKEWRDHRDTSLGFAVATPCLAALAFATLPSRWASDSMILSMVATTAGFAGFAIAALALGSDLAAGEAQRGRDSFLLRLPAGLPAAFLSKLAFWRDKEEVVTGGSEYRIRVQGEGDESTVSVLTREGGEDPSETARKILALLQQQLR